MEKRHTQRLLEKFPAEITNKHIIVLDIPDDYGFMDKEFIDILNGSVPPYLDNASEQGKCRKAELTFLALLSKQLLYDLCPY